jgi:hypothetical protein
MHSHTPFAATMSTLGMLSILSATASAQPRPTDEELLRRIDELAAQVTELRAMLTTRQAEGPRSQPPLHADQTRDDGTAGDDTHDVKFGATVDTYYDYNFNRPIGRVNLLRAYDVTSNNFSLNQASLVVERAPDTAGGRPFGGRVDFQYGQATETLQGSLANEPRPWVYRNIFQAYGTYVAPIGSGLTIDFGKWASALGYENNYTKDQNNYSRSLWFNFLPFYHMGARLNYKVSDALTLDYWITNGTQQTEAFNNFKDQSIGMTLQPAKNVAWTANYYLGQEHPDVQAVQTPGAPIVPTQPGLSLTPVVPYFTGKLNILDTYGTWQVSGATAIAGEADYVSSENPAAPPSKVYGGAGYVRHQLTPATAIAVRAEYLRDRGGLFTGSTQSLKEGTVTYEYRFHDGFLVRTEWRLDASDIPFFITNTPNVLKTTQTTATLGLIWWWGTKSGAW